MGTLPEDRCTRISVLYMKTDVHVYLSKFFLE
jgi:hypothetical protein